MILFVVFFSCRTASKYILGVYTVFIYTGFIYLIMFPHRSLLCKGEQESVGGDDSILEKVREDYNQLGPFRHVSVITLIYHHYHHPHLLHPQFIFIFDVAVFLLALTRTLSCIFMKL